MLDKQFDHIINQKIGDAKMDVPTSDWNVFSQKLKVAMESTGPQDQLFDEAIKTKLATASLEIPKAEWGAFAPKLQDAINSDITDADFDKAILNKVNDPSLAIPAADWNTFADKFSDAQFDASIKDKVEDPNIEIPKPDWPIFASLLADATLAPTEIADSQFDSVIQDKIAQTNIDIPNPNWNALSQKMQDAGLSDQQMDKEVKSKLEDYTTRYEESHWAILREKMLETKYLRRNLFGLKWFEAALSLLLFMTFANFVADGLLPEATPIAEAIENKIDSAENKLTNSNTIAATELAVDNKKEVINNSEPVSKKSTTENSNIKATSTFVGSTSSNNRNGIVTTNTQNISYNAPSKTVINPILEEITASSLVETTIASEKSTVATSNNEAHSFEAKGLSLLDRLNPNVFDASRSLLNPAFAMAPSIEIDPKSNRNNSWNLYLAIGRNTHQIFTPLNTNIYWDAYTRKSNNLSYDLRIGKEFDNIEVMTGLAYQQLNYGTEQVESLTISEELTWLYSIDMIKYDFVKIPLNTRWNYRINDQFGFFADLGISANILMKSDYDLVKNEKDPNTGGSINKPIPVPTPGSSENEDLGLKDTDIGNKVYQLGLIQGGTARESIIGNLDSGIGIKYKINHGIETFARASMSQQLGELTIGPNNDSFSTWALQLGLKYKL